MIGWPGPLAIAAIAGIVIFYVMKKSTKEREGKHSERLQRHREYYDALMERRKKKDVSDEQTNKNEDRF